MQKHIEKGGKEEAVRKLNRKNGKEGGKMSEHMGLWEKGARIRHLTSDAEEMRENSAVLCPQVVKGKVNSLELLVRHFKRGGQTGTSYGGLRKDNLWLLRPKAKRCGRKYKAFLSLLAPYSIKCDHRGGAE